MAEHPSQKLPAEKRAELFRVAGAEFAAHGFSQASLNRIIGALGMSKSSFYHYFANKEDLFRQTLEQAIAPFMEAQKSFDPTRLSVETYWPTIQMMTEEMAHLANRTPELVIIGRMFYRSLDNPAERALTEELVSISTEWLGGLIRQGQALGLVRSDLPESLLLDVLMGLNMALERWILKHWDDLSDDERLALGGKSFELFRRIMQPVCA